MAEKRTKVCDYRRTWYALQFSRALRHFFGFFGIDGIQIILTTVT